MKKKLLLSCIGTCITDALFERAVAGELDTTLFGHMLSADPRAISELWERRPMLGLNKRKQ